MLDNPAVELVFSRQVLACEDCRGVYRGAGVVRRGETREVLAYVLPLGPDGRGEPPCVCDLSARTVTLRAPGQHDHGEHGHAQGDELPF
jgi:hypothetical protein